MSQMLKSSGAMGAATLTSRLLGLVREQVYGWFMGTSAVASAFVLAFTIPNLFRRLLGEGILSASFIPIFKAKEKNEGEIEMWRAGNAVISGLIVASTIICAVAVLVVTVILLFFKSRFAPDTQLMLGLLRLMFPYMILACLAAVMMGILNARGHFFIPTLGAASLNVVMIASVFIAKKSQIFGETLHTQIYGLAFGVLAAGIAQACFQLPSLRSEGFRYRWVAPWRDETVHKVVRQMIPASVGVAAFQINVMLTQIVAFGVDKSINAEFNYATRLMEVPQGVFGISLATFLLPTLSGWAVEKNFTGFRSMLRQGLAHVFFVNLLASILLFILAEPIVRLLFEHGKFTTHSTANVSFAVVCLVPGLVAFSCVNILARAFYALGDIKTPMRISIFCLFINLIFTAVFLFQFKLGSGSLGLANTLSSAFNVALLGSFLGKKLKSLELTDFFRAIPRVLVAAAIAAIIAWYSRDYWTAHFGHDNLALKLGEVFVPMTVASVVYFAVAMLLRVPSAQDITNLLLRR
ncbi:MAG: murein biosynthesis integral membrane protein MurJ [Limisphaerales bacterium]